MKKMLLTGVLVVAGAATVLAQSAAAKAADDKASISLADARGKIDKAIESPAVTGDIVKRLSAADQRQFLADVNKAIAEMPASAEEKAAKFLDVNRAALKAAKKGNTAILLAEVFATVPPEALTVISERFAADLVNRASNPGVTYTDAQFTELAVETMKKINARVEETDIGSARSAMAILMFVRASNGTPADLAEKLVGTMTHDDARQIALKEWIQPALGSEGKEPDYEPLLAAADAGRRPDFKQVLVIANAQYLESILEDLIGKNTDQMSFMQTRTPVLDAVVNPLVRQAPVLHDEPSGGDGHSVPPPDIANPNAKPRPEPQPEPPHPGPYAWQN